MTTVAIIGLGYVGLTTSLGLAKIGNSVIGVEINPERLGSLTSGVLPIFEPGLDIELVDSLKSGRLSLTESIEEAAETSRMFFVCVPTPQDDNGAADLKYVVAASKQIADCASPGSVIVIKSTVPVGTGEMLRKTIDRNDIYFASNPEFLREGSALMDFMEPDRIVVGADTPEVSQRIFALYDNIDAPKVSTSVKSAELIKYAANAYLASRLSFVNDLAALCEQVGADVDDVVSGMGSDSRIGSRFLHPGPGWGGSCFPKDTRALISVAESNGISLGVVGAAIQSNDNSFSRVVKSVKSLLGDELNGKSIAVWGLAFKANTDDTRDSPSLEIIKRLLSEGSKVTAFDPIASAPTWEGLTQVETAVEAATNADALLILTEWSEFSRVDPKEIAKTMSGSVVLDTRRILPVEKWSSEFEAFKILGNGAS
jgi:UDPglucose 6-dehydrogenase